MALISLLLVITFAAVVIVAKVIESRRARPAVEGTKLPGPKGLPFIGNVLDLPAKCSWMKFHEWSLDHGAIYQVNLAGTNHVWIARDNIAHDLLSKRSAIYSDRPFIPALEQDNRTSGQYLPLMSKNLLWSRQRRFAKQIMDKSEGESFYNYPELESVRLLMELMDDPSQYNHAMESFVARVTSRLAWGTPAPAEELKQRARELLIGVSPTGALGNKFPIVMSLPSKAKAWELRRGRTEKKFFETMQKEVRDSLKPTSRLSMGPASFLLPSLNDKRSSKAQPSWTRMFLENQKSWGFASDTEGAYAVGMHGIAGALTIAAPMQSFCLAMCHYPQYQSILHEEIDRVLGDRMPTFKDMPDMPVLRAFIRETLRWRPPVPTGIPHELTEDDVYEGYHIPKGSVIHPLEWSISRDPEVFPDPDAWNPLRWLEPGYPTYKEPLAKFPTISQYSQFGYGRRTCQGMAVTEADLFVALGSCAWLFSIQKEGEDESTMDESTMPRQEEHGSRRGSDSSMASSNFSFDDEFDVPQVSINSQQNDSAISISDDGLLAPKQHQPESNSLTMHANDSAISVSVSELLVPEQQQPQRNSLTIHSNDSAISVSGDLEKPQTSDAEGKPICSVCCKAMGSDTPITIDDQVETTQEKQILTPELPGVWIFPPEEAAEEKPEKRETKKRELPYEDDPTMNFSTLLIAKPLPFKFQLRIRDQARAWKVTQAWIDHKIDGEFEDSKIYWKGGNQGDSDCGWGEVFL